jgi:glycine cleavage system H protein
LNTKAGTKKYFIYIFILIRPDFIIFATQISTMNFPSNLRYTKDHEWIKLDGNVATIGITDYAQRELGDIVYVEVETIGKSLKAGEIFGTVEAVKTVSDLFLPVDGTITELNAALANSPESVNSDPYGEGWMIKMTVNNPADVEALMDAAAYNAQVA